MIFLLVLALAAPAPPSGDVAAVARRLIRDYRDADAEVYRDNLFRLQLAAGDVAGARTTLAELRALRARRPSGLSPLSNAAYEIYADAKLRQARTGTSFDDAFAAAFRDTAGALDDAAAANPLRWALETSAPRLEREARAALDEHPDLAALPAPQALEVVRKVVAADVYGAIAPLIAPLLDEDDRRRYVIETNVLVPTPGGAHVCALVVRPRAAAGPLPALLDFTIYSGPYLPLFEARRSASHGYVGVEGFTRGKACSPDAPVPIEHDGADAAALVEWIARQPWSDGRVGMFGGSYEGFTQWAAAKHLPKPLKAMMPSVTFAPGIDFPMDGNVFMSYAFPWPFFTTDNKGLDNATYGDSARWARLQQAWYVSGRPYRDLDKIDGTPNPIFDRWLEHPRYDRYWQAAIPYGAEFARIGIPVLTTTGYYDSGQIGALYYFAQHHRYRPGAEHYLVIGPYDHIGGQRGTLTPLRRPLPSLRGYALDPAAQIDIGELRYQWFDYVLRGAPKPALLQDKVNFEVMGANVWKHVPSLAAMAVRHWQFHLSDKTQTVDLADRGDADRFARGNFIDQALDDWDIVSAAPKLANAIEFVSEPLPSSTEISGLFSAHLDFVANKKDFDFSVTLFELTPAGQYMQLSYVWKRASFARDRSRRTLLTPGRRTRLDVRSGRLTSRRLERGSRLVVVIAVIKQPGEQIDYGTGKDVSDESIADAGAPLRIDWSGASFIDVPLGR